MKKIIFYIILLCAFIQSYSQVYTCAGGTVNASTYSDISQSQKDAIKANFISTYGPVYGFTAADIIEDPTPTFNCHAYAWHLREGNTNRVWINNTDGSQSGGCYINNNNINKYWTDGCFIQVCNQNDADKIHYYCGDHSAVKSTAVAGKYESKWGQLPGVRHNPTSVPYAQPTSVRYYASTKITGDVSNLCTGTRVFSVKSITGATYSWTYSSTLSVVGATNQNQITVQRNGSSNGAAWVKVQINTTCSSISASRTANFTIGGPAATATITSVDAQPCPGTQIDVHTYIPNSSSITSYNFTVDGVVVRSGTGVPPPVVTLNGGGCGWHNVTLTISNACGSSSYGYLYNRTSSGSFMASPNPATATVNIQSIANVDAANKSLNSLSDIVEINLFDNVGNPRKRWKFSIGTKRAQINVAGLTPGIYILEINNGKMKERQQLIIRGK